MADTNTKRRTETVLKPAKPPLHKVILLNDDYTPREFVVRLLKAEFRVPEAQANAIMLTAHTKGACVVAVFTREVAEEKAHRATDYAQQHGYPLMFSTEPEE
jgi:ATP-dependent Clp protease adaptor protein ClpS